MHDVAFAWAALQAPARILGLPLLPYSLGHELWLQRSANPLCGPTSPELPSRTVKREHVKQAVLICCQSWEQMAASRRDWLMGPKFWIWERRIRKANFELEEAAFHKYRTAGATWPPGNLPTGPQGRTPGSPFILRLHSFLMERLRLSELEAWDYPLGVAQWRWCAHFESLGSFNVWNEDEVEFQKWEVAEKANQEKVRAELRARLRAVIGDKALLGPNGEVLPEPQAGEGGLDGGS